MSMNDKKDTTPVQEEKIVTRYERKLQKRKEQEEKAKKEQKLYLAAGIAVAVAIIALLISFPVRTYLATNETYAEIGGEKVTRAEFDYYYGANFNSFYAQQGMYLLYSGIDLSGDLTQIMYDENFTWDEYFQQMAVESIKQTKAFLKDADANGFEFDEETAWKDFKQNLEAQAAHSGVSLKEYVTSTYGTFASLNNLKDVICDGLKSNLYSNELMQKNMPADDEITAYYEENKIDYDVVDYRVITIDAELPTQAPGTEGESDEKYEPTEAEVQAAMIDAKKKAEAAKATVAAEGDTREAYSYASMSSLFGDWMFDEARKAGDVLMVEDADNNRYQVVAFEKRYLEEIPTANARIITTDKNPQKILDTWTKGDATEESFITLVEQYDTSTTVDGLYEGLLEYTLPYEVADWMFAEERAVGDTTAIEVEGGSSYVIYFKGMGDSEWKQEIKSGLANTYMAEYVGNLTGDMEVVDKMDRLTYLDVLDELASYEEAKQKFEELKASQEAEEGAADAE